MGSGPGAVILVSNIPRRYILLTSKSSRLVTVIPKIDRSAVESDTGGFIKLTSKSYR